MERLPSAVSKLVSFAILGVSLAAAQTFTGGITGTVTDATGAPRFGYPGLAFGNPNFGIVSSQFNRPRLIQFALKLLF